MPEREFEYRREDFDMLRDLAHRHAGIALSDSKSDLVYTRLAKHIRRRGLADFASYIDEVEAGADGIIVEFVNAITTNLTGFFREAHHFHHVESTLVPDLVKGHRGPRRIRIWSSACSTGEEPYSIAIATAGALLRHPGHDLRILATDIDSNVLAQGAAGVYEEDRIGPVPAAARARAFLRGRGTQAGRVMVRPALRQLISFKRLNLIEPWPFRGPFDAIFCRNVVIYFDRPTQRRLFGRMADALTPNGILYLGHSETLHEVSDRFEPLGRTIYRRVR
jgi:chemotaxis protein methyltransferase CheR